jgi:hypothetical protein
MSLELSVLNSVLDLRVLPSFDREPPSTVEGIRKGLTKLFNLEEGNVIPGTLGCTMKLVVNSK